MIERWARKDLRRRAVALLDQQLWCWGRDVARPAGNVLLELGMFRYRSTGPGPGRTAYTGRAADDSVVWLWGFGLLFCLPNLGGVFLRRYKFDPLLIARPPGHPVHAPEHLVGLTRPTTARQRVVANALVRAAAEWVAGYEHWIAETLGTSYRGAALASRDKPTAVPAPEMARAWEHLAKKAPRLTFTQTTLTGARGKLLTGLLPAAAIVPSPERRLWKRYGTTQPSRFRTA